MTLSSDTAFGWLLTSTTGYSKHLQSAFLLLILYSLQWSCGWVLNFTANLKLDNFLNRLYNNDLFNCVGHNTRTILSLALHCLKTGGPIINKFGVRGHILAYSLTIQLNFFFMITQNLTIPSTRWKHKFTIILTNRFNVFDQTLPLRARTKPIFVCSENVGSRV